MSQLDGAYSTVSTMTMTGGDLLTVPVEGFREGWQSRVINNYWLLKNVKKQQGYLFALRELASAEVLPPAYLRSLPIARLQVQLCDVVRRIENGEDNDDDTPDMRCNQC